MDSIETLRNEFDIDTEHRDKEIKDLKESLNFAYSMIEEQKKQVKKITTDYAKVCDKLTSITTELNELKKSTAADHETLVYLDDYGRRNSLRFRNIPEEPRENWEQCQAKVARLLREKLNVQPDIE